MFPILAVAVLSFGIHATEMEGGTGEQTGDLSLSARELIPGCVTVLKNTRGVVAQTGGEPAVPGMIPGGIASHPIPGRGSLNPERGTGGSWDDSRQCGIEETVLFITGHRFCSYQGVFIHTSGLAVASSWMAGIFLPRDVSVAGVWAAMTGGSPAGQSLQYLRLWVAWTGDQGQQTPVVRRRRSSTSCLGVWRGAAADTRFQASLQQLPQPLYGNQSLIAQKAVQRRVWWRVAVTQVRRGQILSC